MNIAEILKNVPKGTKLYSPIFGDVILNKVSKFNIEVLDTANNIQHFIYTGLYDINGECMLFPSRENRDWSKFGVKPASLKFKVGDSIHKSGYPRYTIKAIEEDRYRMKNGFFLRFVDQNEWEIAKFDIKKLKPFDKVLVRDVDTDYWKAGIYSHYAGICEYRYVCVANLYRQCIPYNDETKHLVGTVKDCPEYYKTW